MSLNKFKIKSQDDTHYCMCDHKGREFKVEKQKLSSKAHKLIQALESEKVGKYAKGGEVSPGGYDGRDMEEKTRDEKHEKGRAADDVIMKSATERLDLSDPVQKRRWERMNALLNPEPYADGGLVEPIKNTQPTSSTVGTPLSVDEMTTMALPNQMSTIAESDAAVEQKLAQEEKPLEEPDFSPDNWLIGGAVNSIGRMAGKAALGQVGQMAINSGEKAAGKAVETSASKMLDMANTVKNATLSKIGNLPPSVQQKINKDLDNALIAIKDHLGPETVKKFERMDKQAVMAKIASFPEMRAARQAAQQYINRGTAGGSGNIGTDVLKTGGTPMFAEGGEVDPLSFIDDLKQESIVANQSVPIEAPVIPMAPAVMTVQPEVAPGPVVEAVAPVSAPVTEVTPYDMNTSSTPVGSRMDAEDAMAKAITDQGAAEVKALTELENNIKKLPTQLELEEKNRAAQEQLYKEYQETEINPNRFYENQSTGNKILSALGLILSGAGSGITGQENLAAKVIANAVNADIEAQKANKEGKLNLWKLNREKLDSDKAATLATMNQLYTGVDYTLDKVSSQFKGPLSQAATMKAKALLKEEIDKNIKELAILSYTQESTGGQGDSEQGFLNHTNQIRTIDKDLYKEKMKNYIPGIGITKRPPTEKDRDQLATSASTLSGIDELLALSTQGPTVPGSIQDSANKTKIAALQLEMKNAYQLGVLSESDYKMLDRMVDDPGRLWTGKAQANLKATRKSIEHKLKSVYDKLGVKPFSKGAEGVNNQNAAAVQWLKANPNDPRAPAVRQKLGIK